MSFVQGCRANVGSFVASEVARIRDVCFGDNSTAANRILVPCLGFAGVAQHLNDYFVEVDVCDIDRDVMCMWQHVLRRGWTPRVGASGCTRDQWQNLRRMRPGLTPRRGYLGRVCSSSAPFERWRDPALCNYDFLREGAMYIETARPKMRNVNLLPSCSFEEHRPPRGSVVYLDMPDDYPDMQNVFTTADAWVSRGVLVVVSATEAPQGWEMVYGNVCQRLYVPSVCLQHGWGEQVQNEVSSSNESISGTPCPICQRTVIYTDASFIAQCCGKMYHAACISTHITRQGGGSGCPSCGLELWPSDEEDDDYSPSSEESDDHEYSEDSDGFDVNSV